MPEPTELEKSILRQHELYELEKCLPALLRITDEPLEDDETLGDRWDGLS